MNSAILNNASVAIPSIDMENLGIQGSTFTFSAANIDDLTETGYTLVDIEVDVSGSISGFENELKKAISSTIGACKKAPTSENILVRVEKFDNHLRELHGYKPVMSCNEASDYDSISSGGYTSLNDAAFSGIGSVASYAAKMRQSSIECNGIVVVITDGEDNTSTCTTSKIADEIKKIKRNESLESFLSILIGVNVNNTSCSNSLKTFFNETGFDQYIEVQDASPNSLAKIAKFISQSISSQSQALGSGGPSQLLTF